MKRENVWIGGYLLLLYQIVSIQIWDHNTFQSRGEFYQLYVCLCVGQMSGADMSKLPPVKQQFRCPSKLKL